MKHNQLIPVLFFLCNLVVGQSQKEVFEKYPFTKAIHKSQEHSDKKELSAE